MKDSRFQNNFVDRYFVLLDFLIFTSRESVKILVVRLYIILWCSNAVSVHRVLTNTIFLYLL
jgi:hypothetical protein